MGGPRLLNATADDWEPAVATDPAAPYVYLLTTRYGVQPPGCTNHCPSPFIALTRSSDGGTTFGAQTPLCLCLGSKAQYDPTIEVVPSTGAVYSVFLNGDRHNGFSTVFTKSTDHGATWSAPVHVYGNVSWTDKPEVATGTVVFSESSLQYSGSTTLEGEVWHHAIVSRDGGATWENVVVARVPIGEACVADGCKPDFYVGQTSVVSDTPSHLVFAYEGPNVSGGPQQVYVSASSDEGRTWSAGIPISVVGEDATQPRLASFGGSTRLWYMQTAGGDNPDAWNVWYRSSADGGTTWTAPVKISDAPAGAAGHVGADGFGEVYGDYGEIGVTNTGKTVAAWGEGFSYTGPGGTWFNIQG